MNSIAKITESFRVPIMRSDYRLDAKPTAEVVKLALYFEELVRRDEGALEVNRRDTLALATACRVVIVERMGGLGRSMALEALDQVGDYADVSEALDAYAVNLGDTLTELGVSDRDSVMAALRGFESVLVEHGVSERPHGMESC